jgi:predicted transcriptional regulator of viral defense system
VTQLVRLGELLADGAVWRMRDLVDRGITAATVRRAVASGVVHAVSRGVYRLADAPAVPHAHLAEALLRIPRGLVCLHSAAVLHSLGDVAPARTWIAIPYGAKAPRLEWPPVRIVRWRSDAPFTVGVEERTVCGVAVRATGAARTVVDMLRMSATVGEDRALGCLRDFVAGGGAPGELGPVADAFGVGKRLAPYIKSAAVLWERR